MPKPWDDVAKAALDEIGAQEQLDNRLDGEPVSRIAASAGQTIGGIKRGLKRAVKANRTDDIIRAEVEHARLDRLVKFLWTQITESAEPRDSLKACEVMIKATQCRIALMSTFREQKAQLESVDHDRLESAARAFIDERAHEQLEAPWAK